MRYLIRMEIEVDAAAWQAEYQTPGDANDVEDYLLSHVQQSTAAQADGFKVTGFGMDVLA